MSPPHRALGAARGVVIIVTPAIGVGVNSALDSALGLTVRLTVRVGVGLNGLSIDPFIISTMTT